MRSLFAGFLACAVATPAAAQCLKLEDKPAFETQIRQNLTASDWDYQRIYLHALNRLGYGGAPQRTHPLNPSRTDKWNHLAQRIGNSLRAAAAENNGLDNTLATLPRPNPQSHQHPNPYRFANKSIHAAYNHQYRLQQQLNQARQDFANGDITQEEFRVFQQRRNATQNDFRASAKVRRVAQLVGSQNINIGEVLGEFWLNHFSVDARKATWPALDYQHALRKAQCGTFYNLLRTSAQHPAMLIYLDNYRSRAGALNENYGRELLELHTLGDDTFRYYNQGDVVAAARALTGWGFLRSTTANGNQRVDFKFFASGHDGNVITMFDSAPEGTPLTLPEYKNSSDRNTADAVKRGEALLRYLANHPQTRRNICRKLSRWILGVSPRRIVNGCAADAVWGRYGNLGAVYQYLLSQPEMFHSVAGADPSTVANTYQRKIKNPMEYVVSAQRAARIPTSVWQDVSYLSDLANASTELGLAPAQIGPPTGYPDSNAWLNGGYLLRLNEYLYRALNGSFVTVTVGDGQLRGNALEAHVRGVLERANDQDATERQRRLDIWGNKIARQGLGLYPYLDRFRPSRRMALEEPDFVAPSAAGQPAGPDVPVRTLVHAILGSIDFVRK